MILEIIIFFILFIVIYTFWNQDPPGYPPGPFRIPIIGGSVPNNDERCAKKQEKYGDLILDKVGKNYWLTICDYKLSKEALSKTEAADRFELEAIKELSGGTMKGIGASNGEHWKTNRRFLIHYLRDSGMGKSILEDSVQFEAKHIVAEFNRLIGSTSSLTFLNFAPLNVVWKMVASKRYEVNDPMLDKVQQLNQTFSDSIGLAILMDFIPLLRTFVPKFMANYFFKHNHLTEFFEELAKITQPIIEEHKRNLDRDNPKDLIDMYLMEEENPINLKKEFASDADLRAMTSDIFNAGADTVAITLRWGILYLAKYTHVQTKMQEEIDSVVPRDMLPGCEHRSRLPYCEAVVHEILRSSSLANFGGMRSNSEEFTLGGYTIPKNSIIFSAVSSIHHDPRYWENPNEFNPNRFLDDNGKFFCPKEGFLPFGIGKRQCPGEGLARFELYIFFTAIFQNFSFSAPDGKYVDLKFSKKSVIFHLPTKQDVLVHSRN